MNKIFKRNTSPLTHWHIFQGHSIDINSKTDDEIGWLLFHISYEFYVIKFQQINKGENYYSNKWYWNNCLVIQNKKINLFSHFILCLHIKFGNTEILNGRRKQIWALTKILEWGEYSESKIIMGKTTK